MTAQRRAFVEAERTGMVVTVGQACELLEVPLSAFYTFGANQIPSARDVSDRELPEKIPPDPCWLGRYFWLRPGFTTNCVTRAWHVREEARGPPDGPSRTGRNSPPQKNDLRRPPDQGHENPTVDRRTCSWTPPGPAISPNGRVRVCSARLLVEPLAGPHS